MARVPDGFGRARWAALPMTADAAIDLADAAVYRFWIDEHVRFADLDPLGHANNAAISGYLESVRVALFAHVGSALGQHGRSVVLARLLVEFRAELRYADRLRVGARVVRLGRSSM